VHELRLEEDVESGLWDVGTDTSFAPGLVDCLVQSGGFQAGGIQSIAIDCKELKAEARNGSSCHAFLLGAQGQQIARCGLDHSKRPAQDEGGISWLKMHAGPWRAFAAHGSSAWALKGSTIVSLQWRQRAEDLLPRADLSAAATNVSQLHALPGGEAILGLEGRGRLNAWFMDGSPQMSWLLPPNPRWAGVCATTTALYFVGVGRSDGQLSVWRSALPAELAPAP